jgi:hypothetical protein
METVVITGQVSNEHVLRATVPATLPPGPVTIIVLPKASDPIDSEWMKGVSREWAEELADTRQDIYTLNDGVSLDAS